MKKRNGITGALAAAMILTSSASMADSTLGGFVAGAAIGALINNQVNKNKQQRQQQRSTTQRSSSANSFQRQQNREVQAALNGFGFPVGAVDGALGQRSRAAISNYQSYMGYQPTGYLDDFQRQNLVGAHQRLQAGGGAAYPEVVANEGTKGLLKAFSDPTYANRYRNNGVQSASLQNNNAFADQGQSNSAGAAQAATPTIAPLDLSLGQAPTSMASHCELVVGMTQANQGVVLATNISDPEQALGEQFCEARSFAITQSQGLMSQARQTEDQVSAACSQIADAMLPASAQISTADVKLVATTAQGIANGIFNNDMATASGYGQICLGLGYRQDDAKMALGAATVMLATGQMPYAEVMGHHLRWGFGTTRSAEASNAWYDTALTVMEQGAQPVFVPSKTAERNAIIKASIEAPTGGIPPLQSAGNGGLSLPALNLGNN
ncbi:peptidoglycan-binding domain-containing protein [Roseobacter weihaiensis]|uniref:peptidoglycan-binding domain-containing protein n=1 Tax=Roseobacter weihaiensis TaxID=2763262 RepID=UPI001D0A9614|nr:peptidoglycan-binding domain-containing protein [Roseobacter sp. H9]